MVRLECVRRWKEELRVMEVASAGDGIDGSGAGDGGECGRIEAKACDWPGLIGGQWINRIEDAGEGGIRRKIRW